MAMSWLKNALAYGNHSVTNHLAPIGALEIRFQSVTHRFGASTKKMPCSSASISPMGRIVCLGDIQNFLEFRTNPSNP